MGLPGAALPSIVSPTCSADLSACWQQRVVCRLLQTIKITGKGCAHAQSRIFCDLFCPVGGDCLWAEFVNQGGRSSKRSYLQGVKPYSRATGSNADGGGVLGRHSSGAVLGIDSVTNWSSYFYEPGFDSFGDTQFTWGYTMVGHAPFGKGQDQDWEGETTRIGGADRARQPGPEERRRNAAVCERAAVVFRCDAVCAICAGVARFLKYDVMTPARGRRSSRMQFSGRNSSTWPTMIGTRS
jgi:hypothetical protein